MNSFIERVEIFPERQPDGRILRRIDFRFPVFFEGKEVDMLNWDTQEQVETVCSLVLRKPVTHINIDVDVEELVQEKRGQATYSQIKEYVLERLA